MYTFNFKIILEMSEEEEEPWNVGVSYNIPDIYGIRSVILKPNMGNNLFANVRPINTTSKTSSTSSRTANNSNMNKNNNNNIVSVNDNNNNINNNAPSKHNNISSNMQMKCAI